MAIKQVEMAVRDPANAQRFVTEMVEIQTVRANIRNLDPRSGGHVITDVALPAVGVKFKPGEVKTLEISEALATRIRRREEATWELTSDPPTPPVLADEPSQEAHP